jgi:hypothetical protein
MKKVYAVSYDFADPDEHASFFETLASFPEWWHFLSGTWMVATDLSAPEIYNKLRPHLDEQVNILVMEAGRDVAGCLPKQAWPWIEAHQNGGHDIPPGPTSEGASLAPVQTV